MAEPTRYSTTRFAGGWLLNVEQRRMEAARYRPEFDIVPAHGWSSGHRKQVEASDVCGCFYCLNTFPPTEIEEWVDEDKDGIGQTALCPKCGIDSVLGSKAGFPLTPEFLSAMKKHWF
jgi:hypothetical protein